MGINMKITDTQINKIMKKLPHGVTEDYVRSIVESFPDQTPYAMVEAPLIVAVRRDQGKAKPEDVSKEIQAQLIAKIRSAQGQSAGNTKTITREYF